MMVGGGGREDALICNCARSLFVKRIIAFGTNAGIKNTHMVEILNEKQPDIQELAAIAKRENVGLTIVGPEQPLADGIVDYFRSKVLLYLDLHKQRLCWKVVNLLLKK